MPGVTIRLRKNGSERLVQSNRDTDDPDQLEQLIQATRQVFEATADIHADLLLTLVGLGPVHEIKRRG